MMQEENFYVEGLDCSEEVNLLKKALEGKPGIHELDFDVLNARMKVTFDSKLINTEGVLLLVASTGLRAMLWEMRKGERPSTFWGRHGRLMMTILSGLFLAAGFLTHYVDSGSLLAALEETKLPLLAIIFYVFSILCGGFYVVPKAYFALKRFHPDMNLLMMIAVIGAIAVDQWFEGATVVFLFSVALFLEHWSVGRARRAISSLLEIAPTQVRLLSGEDVAVEEVSIGQHILVRPGERVALDGVVTKGSSSINQAPITGESIPIYKEREDEVYAGTINEDGALEVEVRKEANDTMLARMIHLVQEAQSRRASSEQWVERFAKIYTPIMVLLAFLMAVVPPIFFGGSWDVWIYRALVLLVIACPCALVISTPVSVVAGLTSSARRGVLIKGGIYLEAPAKLQALAMDKTGTLTHAKPEVQKLIPLNGHTEEELLMRAASLEAASEHPIAHAILREAESRNIPIERAQDFQIVKGKGATGVYRGQKYWIGSHRFMHDMSQETEEIHQMAQELEDAGHTLIALGNDHHVCGLLSVSDRPRDGIKEIVEEIRKAGVKEVMMLTGDNAPTAQAIAKVAGIKHYYAELSPEDKVDEVGNLIAKWGRVAMIGDGVNDAPAMARASFGIAMGAIGSDVAIETADIALMSDDLSKIPWLIRHAKRTLRIIKQNIAFALALKAIFIVLAAFGLATLWMAIVADTGATLIVISNGLRGLNSR